MCLGCDYQNLHDLLLECAQFDSPIGEFLRRLITIGISSPNINDIIFPYEPGFHRRRVCHVLFAYLKNTNLDLVKDERL